jgi:hypothetical protein
VLANLNSWRKPYVFTLNTGITLCRFACALACRPILFAVFYFSFVFPYAVVFISVFASCLNCYFLKIATETSSFILLSITYFLRLRLFAGGKTVIY